jgi:small subunit ribosomal protein S21
MEPGVAKGGVPNQPVIAVWCEFGEEESGFVRIDVYDNNVDQAIRVLKKKMIREGMFREMKKRKFFEKPSERKRRKKAEAVRRLRKKMRRSVAGPG